MSYEKETTLEKLNKGSYTDEEKIKILTEENILLRVQVGSCSDYHGQKRRQLDRNNKEIERLKNKKDGVQMEYKVLCKESKGVKVGDPIGLVNLLAENKVDLIVSKCGDCILLKDVKDGDTILYNNTPGFDDKTTFKCQVHKDLKKGTTLKTGRDVREGLVISADLGTGDCLMVYLNEETK